MISSDFLRKFSCLGTLVLIRYRSAQSFFIDKKDIWTYNKYIFNELFFNESRLNKLGIRDEQKEKRRNEILAAGLDLFICKGYAATKISDIAQHVGMSAGLLFHYFKSKESLYEELIKIGISGPMHIMALNYEEPLAFFENAAKQIFDSVKTEQYTAKMFVLMSQAFYNEAAPQSVKDMLSGFDIYTPTALLIQKGQANGTIRAGDPTALAIAYWCAIQGIAELIAMNPNLPCPESNWVVDIIRRKSL